MMTAAAGVKNGVPLPLAKAWIAKARTTGDAGFYTLAEQALDCQISRNPDDVDAVRLKAHVWIQFHRFAEVEKIATELVATHAGVLDYMLLGDAQMEQGKLDAARESYQKAMNIRPSIDLYDRVGWLRWLWGDIDGAEEMANLAVQAGTTDDPETFAWVLTRLGWLHALRGKPYPEIEAALRLVPHYKPALFANARIIMESDPELAAAQLREVGATVEARWALLEFEPNVTVDAVPPWLADVKLQDPRGYAIAISDADPAAALAILDEELKVRQDATTHMAHAYALYAANLPGAEPEARAALATGIVEPRVLLQAGQILEDPALLVRARSFGPGLTKIERARAEVGEFVYRRHSAKP